MLRQFLLLLFLFGCSTLEKQIKLVNAIESSWKGRSHTALKDHPYFSTLTFKDNKSSEDITIRTYYRRGKYPTAAYCASLGGCVGMEPGDCYHVFRIKLNIVDQYRQQGNCRLDNHEPERFYP